MEFRTHLTKKGYAQKTCNRHNSIAKSFIEWCKSEELELEQVDYTAMMNYIYYEKDQGNTTGTIKQKLNAIGHYYIYLNIGINPTRLVQLRSDTKQTPHNLLNSEELDKIYGLCPTHGLVKRRDKVLLSLVIYQGVSSSELPLIEVKDVSLIEGKIYIPAIRTTNGRTLELKPFQLLLMQDYLLKVRPEILKESKKSSERLLVSTGQGTKLHNVVSILLRSIRPYYPKFKSFQQIRQSVITIWVKEHGVRKAQYMAGHRYVSSTERYNEDARESLKQTLKMLHPLQ